MAEPLIITPEKRLQRRLLVLATLFMLIYAAALTISPVVRAREWTGWPADLRWTHWLGVGAWLVFAWLLEGWINRRLPDHDPYLLPITSLLLGWGLLTIYRLWPEAGLRQSAWVLFGGALAGLGIARLTPDLSSLRRYKYVWLTGGLLLTALTFWLGTNPLGYGPRMWLGAFGIYLQPSEPLKLLLIIYLAAYLSEPGTALPASQHPERSELLRLLAPTLVMTGLALGLLVVQRDLGTASIFLFLYTIIVYLSTARRIVPLSGALVITAAGVAGMLLFDLVRLRIDAWLNPWLDPSGRSYQIVQSLLAVANGGVFGRGPGLGNPGVVPVPHSDFIYASIVEEAGLMGGLAMLALLAMLVGRGLQIAMRAADPFRRLLAGGLTAYLGGQSILIIGGNLRLLPLTGVTLPFVSYGGSSLMVSLAAVMLLVMISSQPATRLVPQKSNQPYLHVGGLLFAGLIGASLTLGWWGVVRGPDLLLRTDNP
ncbi:MAG TPA: FtsW/RodA/SpoVE family cell cycle protein, partial [Anaerolineales bacterium]|nr:FtsW/RodA/SpoVE family cell cycle protein [Anaerolineales bacterium]